MNAAEAEEAIFSVLELRFARPEITNVVVRKSHRRADEQRTEQARREREVSTLRRELSEAEAEARRLVEAISQGALVDVLAKRMREVESRRERLRAELAALETGPDQEAAELLPVVVYEVLSDLKRQLEAGRIEQVKRILRILISKAEVHDIYRPERKRPFARLILRGELEGILILASELKIKIGGSPGGPWPLLKLSPSRLMQIDLLGRRGLVGREGLLTASAVSSSR